MAGKRLLALVFAIVLLVGCGGGEKALFKRHETLYVGGFQWVAPFTFNPLSNYPAWPVTGNVNLMYECLFGYNMLTGELDPILGKNYSFDGNILSVELNEQAMWHDGTPVTADDVLFTFELHRKYATHLQTHWRYIDLMESDGQYIRFRLNPRFLNPLVMKDILGTTQILPRLVFENLEKDARTIVGDDPSLILAEMQKNLMTTDVQASGPYTIHSYSPQKIVLERVDTYWGNKAIYGDKKPAPRYIIHPIYKSNDKYNLALQLGTLDISQTFCTHIRSKFESGIGTWLTEPPFYIPGAITALFVNLGAPVEGFTPNSVLKDPAFRRAVAMSIDYEKIREIAIEGYVPPMQPGFIIDDNVEKLYFNDDDAMQYGVQYDRDDARALLVSAGYSWDADGALLMPSGVKVQEMRIESPLGWSDWETAVKIAIDGMRRVGIPVREDFGDEGEYRKNLSYGYFDMIVHTPHPAQSASLPWSRFDATLASQDMAPIGMEVWSNQGRYYNPVVDSLLDLIPTLTDDAKREEAYHHLNRLFMIDLPVIPLMYRPSQYYQFSTKYWDNFPTDANPYAPPQLLMTAGGIKGLWGIHAKTQR